MDKKHLLVRLGYDPQENIGEEAVGEGRWEVEESVNIELSSKFDDVFDLEFAAPLYKESKRSLGRVLEFRQWQQCLL